MIRPDDTNTGPPLNVYDDELNEDLKELPTARPMTEITPMTYVIYKTQLISAFGQIVESVQTLVPTSYEQVMKLDHKLREIHANVPPVFRMRSMDESLRDPSALVMQRYILDLLFLKSQCVLHRKFICPSRESTRYVYSRRTSIDNAMEMLKHQATLHSESRPGGRLSNVKWFISSLTTNDFLLAAMIVALDLYHTAEAERSGRRASNDVYDWSHERRGSMLAALEQSRTIWETLQDSSMEALKAYGVLTAMMSKLQIHEAQLRQAVQQGKFTANGFPQGVASTDESTVAPEHSAAMTLGMLSTGAMTSDAANMFAQYPASAPSQATNGATDYNKFLGTDTTNAPISAASPFSNLFAPNGGVLNMDMGNNIDWVNSAFDFPFTYQTNHVSQDAWDSFLQNSTVNVDPMAGVNGGGNTGNPASGIGLWPGVMNMNVDLNAGGADMANGDGNAGLPTNGNGNAEQNATFSMNSYMGSTRSAF